MQLMIDAISELYKDWKGGGHKQLDVLPQSGSERRYFRLYDTNECGTRRGVYRAIFILS